MLVSMRVEKYVAPTKMIIQNNDTKILVAKKHQPLQLTKTHILCWKTTQGNL